MHFQWCSHTWGKALAIYITEDLAWIIKDKALANLQEASSEGIYWCTYKGVNDVNLPSGSYNAMAQAFSAI